jgi:hypothetical protein
MSSSKADPEVQVGAELGFGKRCALISASVLLTTAGALSCRHAFSAGTAAGVEQRQLQGRRLPHYTTYGGTSYDFHGGGFQPFKPTSGVSGQVVNFQGGRGGFGRAEEAKLQPCCCTEEAVDIPDGGFCTMQFVEEEEEEYSPEKPGAPARGGRDKPPPMTEPDDEDGDKPPPMTEPDDEDEDEDDEGMTLEGTMKNSCCCNEKPVPWMSETCTMTADDR